MTAKEWRDKGAQAAETDLKLPSGMVIRARRPGPIQFAEWDRFPLMLELIEKARAGEGISLDEARETAAFLSDLLMYCCLQPKVSLTLSGDAIHPSEIPEADWIFLVKWALRIDEMTSAPVARMEPISGEAGV